VPVHINYSRESHSFGYQVMTVMLTNQGLYVIDDQEQSWHANPENRKEFRKDDPDERP